MVIDPHSIDIRIAVGKPHGETPLKMVCPRHRERIGTDDPRASLAVYRSNLHCYGCGWHVTRRYASLAFLIGEWDGRGSEGSMRVQEAVRRIKPRLGEFVSGKDSKAVFIPPPIDPYTPLAFHHYLLRYGPLERLMGERGLTLETVEKYKLGYTGTHFTLPIYGLDGRVSTIRYRADDRMVDPNDEGYRKYEGTWGHNSPMLYALPTLIGLTNLSELWITEGEFDCLASNQAGNVTLTVTNGATNVPRIVELIFANLPRLSVKRWIVAVDQDNAGEVAASKVMSILSECGQSAVRARWPRGKDLGEFFAGGGSQRSIWHD